MSNLRGGLALDLIDFGWFQAPQGVLRPIIAPIRIHYFDTNLHRRGQTRHYIDTILTFLWLVSGSSSFLVTQDGQC